MKFQVFEIRQHPESRHAPSVSDSNVFKRYRFQLLHMAKHFETLIGDGPTFDEADRSEFLNVSEPLNSEIGDLITTDKRQRPNGVTLDEMIQSPIRDQGIIR